ncbi:MAG: holo-ACP synthase [Candidatus Zixiibacteriota bacterium]|nr:MAG: holo-ACP synthase [candidate division Zixibacteria bacterium]
MIYSIGIDLVQIRRIRAALDRYGDKFAKRILGEKEWEIYLERLDKANFLSGRFAAKEAVMKTLLSYFEHGELYYKSVQILNDIYGMPYVHLEDTDRERIFKKEVKISISHEREIAAAVAIMTGD